MLRLIYTCFCSVIFLRSMVIHEGGTLVGSLNTNWPMVVTHHIFLWQWWHRHLWNAEFLSELMQLREAVTAYFSHISFLCPPPPNVHLSPSTMPTQKYTNTWLCNFQSYHEITQKNTQNILLLFVFTDPSHTFSGSYLLLCTLLVCHILSLVHYSGHICFHRCHSH